MKVLDDVIGMLNDEDQLIKKEGIKLFNLAFIRLSKREKEILLWRKGYYGENGNTLKNIGEKFNISPERVRQIEYRAASKVRLFFEYKKLRQII